MTADAASPWRTTKSGWFGSRPGRPGRHATNARPRHPPADPWAAPEGFPGPHSSTVSTVLGTAGMERATSVSVSMKATTSLPGPTGRLSGLLARVGQEHQDETSDEGVEAERGPWSDRLQVGHLEAHVVAFIAAARRPPVPPARGSNRLDAQDRPRDQLGPTEVVAACRLKSPAWQNPGRQHTHPPVPMPARRSLLPELISPQYLGNP